MQVSIRPRRSVLYMPGSNSRAIEKSRSLSADCLILDLEDAVSTNEKQTARDQVTSAVQAGGFGHREIVVRINALNTPWGTDDLNVVANLDIDAVLIPKAESHDDIDAVANILTQAGATELPIWIMAETPRGIINLNTIAAHPRVTVIVMGTSDLAKDLHVSPLGDRAGLQYALGAAIMAARAQGLDIIDGVYLDMNDIKGFEHACEQGRELGFDGKSLLHPRQISPANNAFGISQASADQAREIVDAWQAAREENKGVIVVHGRLVEQLHVDEAQRILHLYALLKERDKISQ
jgi:citrate lyase subunit beta/citryl-CoA lyase